MKSQLEKGKLYQVNVGPPHDWIIAVYVNRIEAHTANGYRSTDNAKEWREPAKDYWRSPLSETGFSWCTLAKNTQVRPVAADTLADIKRLKAAIKESELQTQRLRKELRSLCQ